MSDWKKIIVSGSDAELNSLYTPSITGSLHGTASYAISSSYSNTSTSASYAVSASYAATSALSERTTQTDVLVLNQTGFNIPKGTVVRITGSNNSSDIPRINTASYESDNVSANTLGITTQAINNGTQGYVITEGILLGIDTSNYIPGQLIYLGATGSITGSAPLAPLHAVRLGEVVRQQSNNGSIYVRIDNGAELGELHDVRDTTTTSSYGDLLVKSGSVWINSKQLTGSYAITGSLIISSSGAINDFQVGTNKLFVSASGNVGIGTSTAPTKLTIQDTIGDPVRIVINDDTKFNRILFQKPSQTWSAGTINTNDFAIGDETAVAYRFRIFSGSSNIQINPNGTGSVSIGTTVTGSAKLHVNNTTTQNSLLVEDETNPDSTPFVIDNLGSVAIGQTSSLSGIKLTVNGNTLLNNNYLCWVYDGASNNDYIVSNDSPHGGTGNTQGFYIFKHDSTLSVASGSGNSTLDAGSICLNRPTDINYIAGNVGIGITTPSASLHVNNTTPSASFLVEDSTNPDTTPFIIDATGNTGIGTTTPTHKLHVYNTDSNSVLIERSSSFNAHIQYKNTSGSMWAGLTPLGNFSIGNQADLTSGLLTVVSSSGNVGIGTPTPNAKLDVSGSLSITGSISLTNILTLQSINPLPSAINGSISFSSSGDFYFASGSAWHKLTL
jgi:hypothetical protein